MVPSFVQSANTTFATAVSYAVAFGSPNTQGNTLIAVSYNSAYVIGSPSIPSVSDTQGNTWILLDIVEPISSGQQVACFICFNCKSGANTVTFNTNSPAGAGDLIIAEYTASFLDQHAVTTNSGTVQASPLVTTTVANELIIGYSQVFSGSLIAGAGFTSRVNDIGNALLEDKTVAVIGSYSATATSSNGSWAAGVITLSSTPPPSPTIPIVQTVRSYINSTSLTTHVTAAFDSTGGDVIILFASVHSGVTLTPSDSKNNTWTSLAGPTSNGQASDLRSQVWYAKQPVVGAGHTVTMNLSVAQPLVMSVVVIKGSLSSAPIDAFSVIASGNANVNVASPNVTTTAKNDLLIGFAKPSVSEFFAPGTGYIALGSATTDFCAAAYELAAATGTYNSTFTLTTAADWQSVVVAISPPTQPGTVISCASVSNGWSVIYQYQLDSGLTAQTEIVVGSNGWTSPTSTFPVYSPGSSIQVLLPCPDLVKLATFGVSSPTQTWSRLDSRAFDLALQFPISPLDAPLS